MDYYEIANKGINIASGEVGLTDAQLPARVQNLKPVKGKKGVYMVDKPIQFKVGEIIRLETPLRNRYTEMHTRLLSDKEVSDMYAKADKEALLAKAEAADKAKAKAEALALVAAAKELAASQKAAPVVEAPVVEAAPKVTPGSVGKAKASDKSKARNR